MEYKCEVCNKNYKSYKSLWNHNSKYHNNNPNFGLIESTNGHIHQNNGLLKSDIGLIFCEKNNLQCKYCKKIFKSNSNKCQHENKHCKIKKSIITQLQNKIVDLENKLTPIKGNRNNSNILYKNLEIIKNDIIQIKEVNPVNNQLINIILDKNKSIEELKNKLDNRNNLSSSFTLNNINIFFRIEDNYISANQLCQAGEKQFNDWYLLESTKEIIDDITSDYNIIDSKLIDLNSEELWIHPDLAIQLAHWISPKFGLQINKWLQKICNNNSAGSKQKEIETKEQKIQLLQDIFVKKQKRKKYSGKNVIYIITTEDNIKKRIYIIGKATNLKNRLSTYNKTAEHEVVYYKECKQEEYMNKVENMVLIKLDKYREKANRDRFVLPVENDISLFTDIIENSIKFFN